MVTLKAMEICPKKDNCIFAEDNGQKCYGCCERNSTFVCDLDFVNEDVQSLLACGLQT